MELSYILNSPDVERVATALETVAVKTVEAMDGKIERQLGQVNKGKVIAVGDDGIASPASLSLSDAAINAILNCFIHVAWSDENGINYYNALSSALSNNPIIIDVSGGERMQLIADITGIAVGEYVYDNYGRYTLYDSNTKSAGAKLDEYTPVVGDVIRLSDPLGRYKFTLGTGDDRSSPSSRYYVRTTSTEDYVVIQDDIAELKCVKLLKVDSTAFSDDDISFLNSNMHIYRPI